MQIKIEIIDFADNSNRPVILSEYGLRLKNSKRKL
jgi:hypothetical protein